LSEGPLLFPDPGESGAPAFVEKSRPPCSPFTSRAFRVKTAQRLPSPILKFEESLHFGLSLDPLLGARYQLFNHLSALLNGLPIRLIHSHIASAVTFRIVFSAPRHPINIVEWQRRATEGWRIDPARPPFRLQSRITEAKREKPGTTTWDG
jgi:hypothetical protein